MKLTPEARTALLTRQSTFTATPATRPAATAEPLPSLVLAFLSRGSRKRF